ncbi:MAG: DUF2029 domain-containing protein [Lachnospiraceae bacterium]|nr:DUF2029 domain-containing protein [Lachnospiraceae bacterium]
MDRLKELCANKTVRIVVLCVLALMAAVSVFAGVRNAVSYSQDFQWDAAKALSLKIDPYELSKDPQKASGYPELNEFYRMFTDRGLTQKMEANQFPSLLMLLGPMTLIPAQTAKTVWCVLNLLFAAGIIVLLRKTFFRTTDGFVYAAVSLLMLAGTPFRNQIGVGQHTLFAFFFFMLAVYFEDNPPKGSAALRCMLVSLCLFVSYFKYTLTAPLALYFIYRKRYKEIAFSVLGHVVLTQCAAMWLGKSFIYMIKAPLEVASALAAEGGIDLGVLLGGKVSIIVAFAIAVILTVMTLKLPEGRENILFASLILWSLVLTYHRTYDFFVLSAVAMMFGTFFPEESGEKIQNALLCWYIVLLFAVYFGLRLFNENIASKAAVGVIYYAFAVAVTVLCMKLIRKKDNG